MSQLALTISSSFVNAFLSAAEVAPVDIEPLLIQAGISQSVLREAGGRVTEEQFASLYLLLVLKFNDEMPNLLSHRLRGGAMKFAGLAVISASTIKVAIYRYSQLMPLMGQDFEMRLICGPEFSTITLIEPKSGRRCKTMGLVMQLKVVHGFVSWMAARELRLIRVDFAFDKPEYAADIQNFFPGPVCFDQPCSQLVFESSQINQRPQRNIEDLKTYLARLPHVWMFVPAKERLTSHQVRDHLLRNDLGKTSIEQTAHALNVSVRTLYRRLEEERTSFQQVKDEVRRDVAIERLIKSQATLVEIANELGFGDVSSFHRAFRAWTGVTPNTYRQGVDGHATETKN
jgi:AraC-like DNA-binding protein